LQTFDLAIYLPFNWYLVAGAELAARKRIVDSDAVRFESDRLVASGLGRLHITCMIRCTGVKTIGAADAPGKDKGIIGNFRLIQIKTAGVLFLIQINEIQPRTAGIVGCIPRKHDRFCSGGGRYRVQGRNGCHRVYGVFPGIGFDRIVDVEHDFGLCRRGVACGLKVPDQVGVFPQPMAAVGGSCPGFLLTSPRVSYSLSERLPFTDAANLAQDKVFLQRPFIYDLLPLVKGLATLVKQPTQAPQRHLWMRVLHFLGCLTPNFFSIGMSNSSSAILTIN